MRSVFWAWCAMQLWTVWWPQDIAKCTRLCHHEGLKNTLKLFISHFSAAVIRHHGPRRKNLFWPMLQEKKIHKGRGRMTTRGRSRNLGSWEVTSLTTNTEQRVNWEWGEPVNSQNAAITPRVVSEAGDPEFKCKGLWDTCHSEPLQCLGCCIQQPLSQC